MTADGVMCFRLHVQLPPPPPTRAENPVAERRTLEQARWGVQGPFTWTIYIMVAFGWVAIQRACHVLLGRTGAARPD